MNTGKHLLWLIIIISVVGFQSCSESKKKDVKKEALSDISKSNLIIFHSNNLNNAVDEVIAEFSKLHPDIKVTSEAGSNMQTIRKITEQNKICDILILSDYSQLDRFLLPTYSDWSIPFAGNEMVIAYTDKSKRGNEINAKNWYKILLDKNVKYGRADKDSDICGTKTVLMVKLAEGFYKQNGLSANFAEKDKKFILHKEGELLPLLSANNIDYIFAFKSFAIKNKLKYISLPVEINLSSLDHIFDYSKVRFEKKGRNKAKGHSVVGLPLLYGMTIPNKSPNIENALLFAEFLVNPKQGQAIFEKLGNNVRTPIPTNTFGKVPAPLKKYTQPFDQSQKMPPPENGAPLQPPK
jgi:molybdate/tungstate transport system substrate-binding protein